MVRLIRPEYPRGSDHYRSRFMDEEVLLIRNLHANKGIGFAKLAREYKTRPDTIRNLCLGYTYANVGGPRCQYIRKTPPSLEKINMIRQDHANGMQYTDLVDKYKMSKQTIKRITKLATQEIH
jgi:hypothetical protein